MARSELSGRRWSSTAPEDSASRARTRLLLICDYRPREASTVVDHIQAIGRWSRSSVFVLPAHGDLPDELDLQAFDALVIHYSVVMSANAYLSPLARWRIRSFSGPKAAFIQDEHRFVDQTVGVIRALGIGVLFTCFPQDQVDIVYPRSALPELRRTVTVLTGYVPQHLVERDVPPYDARPIDVGYRARRLPPWLGRLAREKSDIADRFARDAPAHGLRVDISTEEEDRLYGEDWIRFLGRSKAMLGVESGASVVDLDGSIEGQVRAYLAEHPQATFEDVHQRFLRQAEGRIRMNQISPRCFEAAALGTLMVLYPGDYSGVLEPWRHYVPLEKDHSNMGEVVDAIRDPVTWQRVTSQARAEVALNPAHAYRAMATLMDNALDLTRTASTSVNADEFERIAERSFARLSSTRQWAFGLPPGVNRYLMAVGRLPRQLTPSSTAAMVGAGWTAERAHRLRQAVRRGRAVAYWMLRPRMLPWSVLATHRGALLEDLGRLASLQEIGSRALRTTGSTPFVAVLAERERAIRLVASVDAPIDLQPENALPDLGWVRTIELHLDNSWFAPPGISAAGVVPMPALAAVFGARPDVGRRLLIGKAPWTSAVRAVTETESRPSRLARSDG
jgi:Glycosyl transferases group 1